MKTLLKTAATFAETLVSFHNHRIINGLRVRRLSSATVAKEKRKMLAQLIPKQGGPAITLSRPITVVGRSSRLCDLVIDNTNISKQHCILVKTDGLIYLRDLASTNGTRVNGQRVVRGALLPGDLLSFSGFTYKVHLGPDQPVGGKVSMVGPTEMVAIVDDAGLNANPSSSGKRKADDASKSDVRFLRDSDLLLPD